MKLDLNVVGKLHNAGRLKISMNLKKRMWVEVTSNEKNYFTFLSAVDLQMQHLDMTRRENRVRTRGNELYCADFVDLVQY